MHLQVRSSQRFILLVQQHWRKEHGAKQRKPSDTVADLNKIVEEESEDGEKLKEELSVCQHLLVDKEMENGRQKVFSFQCPS